MKDLCFQTGGANAPLKRGYVYILASKTKVLYIGVTSDLVQRVWEHKHGKYEGFSDRYRTHHLVYVEEHEDMRHAIGREKELKGWRREKKVALIESQNPTWQDLAAQWFEEGRKAD